MKYLNLANLRKYRLTSKTLLTLVCLSAGILATSCQGGGSDGKQSSAKGNGLKSGSLSPTTGDLSSIIAGALGTVPGADGKALKSFMALWKEKTGKGLTAYVPHNWDATVLMMLAAEASDANTGEGIKSKILDVANAPGTEVSDACEAMKLVRQGRDINFQGASGNVDIDKNGDVVGSYDVWQVGEDGSLSVIDKVNPVSDE